MSAEYFEVIPHYEFSWDKVEPLTNDDQLSHAVQKLNNLLDLELTNRILLGAQHRIKGEFLVDQYGCILCSHFSRQ